MKKYLLATLLLLFFISCEENFDPFGDLKNKYALNCIIRADTTFQIAALTRTYQNVNYDPYSSTVDPNVAGARIRLWNGDSVVTFKDTSVVRPARSKYQTPYHLYYTKKFELVSNKLEIEAILPNNVRLYSQTTVPNQVKFIAVDNVIPPKDKSTITYGWVQGSADNAYMIQFSIYYYKADDPKKTPKIAYIPMQYVNQNGTLYPVVPKPFNDAQVTIDMATVSKTMELISAGDSNKSNYVILSPILEVVSFDKNLSTYFNSITRANDTYAVNLAEVDYTNITNGFGIFGVYFRNYRSLGFTHSYIRSFGYTPGLVDVE